MRALPKEDLLVTESVGGGTNLGLNQIQISNTPRSANRDY